MEVFPCEPGLAGFTGAQNDGTAELKFQWPPQTEPGLVTFYNIRPGNGVSLFLQPWSPHGVQKTTADD